MNFSILVPVYNVEKYLEQCVESLLLQTYKGAYEIILVDDGSTDNSSTICDRYAQKFPKKIKVIHKVNQGLISARDVGINNASGKYSIFVDSDDFVEGNMLELLSDEIEQNCVPDMVIYSFQYYNNGEITKRKVHIPDRTFSKDEKSYFYQQLICSPTFSSLWTKAVKTDILKNDPNDYTRFYGKNMGEDWLRSIHIFTEVDTIVCRNVPLYNYRTNEKSISKSFYFDLIEKQNTLHVYEQFLSYLPKWQLDDEEHRQMLKKRWITETIYTFSKFYECAKTAEERKQVVDFDWDSFLPQDFSLNQIEEYGVSRKIYEFIKNKKYLSLRLYFLKKSTYQKYKKLKTRLKR